ncbi:MAG: pseudouridine synthase, partial [Clostridia bacterium]|nr:pseudouridine synthase [Clostridia bacterium]
MKDNRIRLQKFLSECGAASRRKAEELIAAGKVKVNGRIAQIGDKVDPKRDKVLLSGKR